MTRRDEILGLPRAELAALLAAGNAIDPETLQGFVYRGVSLGLPAWVDRLAWKTFAKTFHRDPESGALRGWNVRLEQTGVDGPLIPQQRGGEPFSFGHFEVRPLVEYAMPRDVPAGLMLDYGRGGNPRFDVSARVRDPIVAIEPGNADLLLGWTYLDLGVARVATPSYFTLERLEPLLEPVPRPRAA